jgi:hypothetical protein
VAILKNVYEIRGEITAIFVKYKGKVMETIIDSSDLPMLIDSEFYWYVSYAKTNKSFYVQGSGIHKKCKQNKARLHRFLMGNPKGKLIDHINHDTLDNRRSVNLREATVSENLQNRKGLTSHNTSGFRGVSFDKSKGKYRAYIRVNNKLKALGCFESAVEAADVASAARRKYMPYSNEVNRIGS